jgi:MinD superfamily P-loop ATPase
VTAALAHQASTDEVFSGSMIVDADVDAANLELVVGAGSLEVQEFEGSEVAFIDPESCLVCGICQEFCRFDAISFLPEGLFKIDPMACEGCAACFYQCPSGSIQMVPRMAGHWFRSVSRFGPLFHARLRPAQENSGKLVSLIKEKAKRQALEKGSPLMLVDGPPGIACPAIAAASGADLALIVTEPTVAGLHDLQRAEKMVAHFRLPSLVCINKADINPEGSDQIEGRCRERGVQVVGRIPFDSAVPEAMAEGMPVTEYRPEAGASRALSSLWRGLREILANGTRESRLARLANVGSE